MSTAAGVLMLLAQVCVTQQAKLTASDGLTGDLFGVSVDMVLMYASVFNKAGSFVAGLKKDSFKLYEDGIPQNLEM